MLVQESETYLYHLTLQRQANYTHSCNGHFVGVSTKYLQLCLATETHIELYDLAQGTLNQLVQFPLFSTVTNMCSFKLPHTSVHYLAIISDSGNLTVCSIVERDGHYKLKTLLNEPMTRSGMRRLSPISYCAVDPKSRCIMVSAVEKFKYIYMLNESDGISISSPLEAIRSDYITLEIAACNVEYIDNPHFASLELESGTGDCHLVFYIADLNLNYIIKKADYKLESNAGFIMDLPNLSKYGIATSMQESEFANPFVLVGTDNHINVRDLNGYYNIKVPIPKRSGSGSTSTTTTIISGTTQILKGDFFVLLQSNHGDLFKLQIKPDSKDRNRPTVSITYFDTINPAEQLHIFKNGYLYANSEFNDNYLFQFESLGSTDLIVQKHFTPSENVLENLSIADTQKLLNPVLAVTTPQDSKHIDCLKFITNSTENSIRTYSNTISFEKLISSKLPPNPLNIWTLKSSVSDTFHNLLVLGFSSSTLFLNINNDAIQDLKLPTDHKSFILKNDKTIHMVTMQHSSIIQVCTNQLVQVSTKNKIFEEALTWYPPAGIHITSATSTSTQLIISLSNNEITYFEIQSDGSILESTKKLSMSSRITKLACYDNPKNPLQRSKFLIVATQDKMINVVSLMHDSEEDEDEFMEIVAFQKLVDVAHDVLYTPGYIHVGLVNGVYVRSEIMDGYGTLSKTAATGEISNVWNKYIGAKPISLSVIKRTYLPLVVKTSEQDEDDEDDDDSEKEKILVPSVVIHADTTWISYVDKDLLYVRTVSFPDDVLALTKISEFTTETLKFNGCCSLSKSGELIIGHFKDFIFQDKWFQLEEQLIVPPDNEKEDEDDSDDGSDEEDEELNQTLTIPKYRTKKILNYDRHIIYIEDSTSVKTPKQCRISIMGTDGQFLKNNGSVLHQPLQEVKYLNACLVDFSTSSGSHLVISTKNGKLLTYEINIKKESFNLKLMHETITEDRISGMCQFNHMLLVCIFNNLVLYSMGKKQLLKKSITRTIPSITKVVAIANWKDEKIAIGDIHESAIIYKFDKNNNQFKPLADDISKRHVTTLEFLDEFTIIGGDRFGNIWTLRLPENVNENNLDVVGNKKISGNIMECPYKLKLINHFYINDIALKFFVVSSIYMSGRDCIVYIGLQGTIGVLVPIISKNEIKLLKKIEKNLINLEMTMFNFRNSKDNEGDSGNVVESEELEIIRKREKTESAVEGSYSIVGRDETAYRGYYAPVRNVIDGDLCETFIKMQKIEQDLISKQISSNFKPIDVIRTINEIRTSYI